MLPKTKCLPSTFPHHPPIHGYVIVTYLLISHPDSFCPNLNFIANVWIVRETSISQYLEFFARPMSIITFPGHTLESTLRLKKNTYVGAPPQTYWFGILGRVPGRPYTFLASEKISHSHSGLGTSTRAREVHLIRKERLWRCSMIWIPLLNLSPRKHWDTIFFDMVHSHAFIHQQFSPQNFTESMSHAMKNTNETRTWGSLPLEKKKRYNQN